MGEAGGGIVVAKAEAEVLISLVVMWNVHMVVVVLAGEMMTEIISPIETRGLEAVALDIGVEVEAPWEEGTGVQSKKIVLKEGLKLSSGIEKRNKQNWLMQMLTLTVMMIEMVLQNNPQFDDA